MNSPPSHSSRRFPIIRIIAVFLVDAASLAFMAWVLPDISVSGWKAAVLGAGVIALLNAVLWPFIARFAGWLILWTAGLFGILLNGVLLYLAADAIDGLEVTNLGYAILASLGMTASAVVVSSLLSLDDDAVWRRQTIKRMVNRLEPAEPTDIPGVMFIQIDGLSEPVLRAAVRDGYAPTLARWIRSGTHRIVGWECDLSSQTGASQAGILHGNNVDMPAFRWYDKEAGKVFTSNRPKDAAEIERRQSDGHGLLAEGGVSRSNVFSGDSPDSLFTFSTVTDRTRQGPNGVTYFLADPYAISRILALMIADIVREIRERRQARRRDVQPRLHRGGIYPLLRAATTVALRDLTVYTLMSDIYRGVPSVYADFVGYDEVAHHSGISAPGALEVLYRLDQQFARLEYAIAEAPRPYHVVVLSDHGQTQGSTFLQRYDKSLEDVVGDLIGEAEEIGVPTMTPEGWGNLNGALSNAISEQDSRLAGLIRTVTRKRTVDGEVVLGPGRQDVKDSGTEDESDVIVLASGNLGLISFTRFPARASLEELAVHYPGLVLGLAAHPGIGFLLVKSETLGGVIVGARGVRYLDDDRVEGEDPLAPFGPRAADHLRRTNAFRNTPDILVNSFFDHQADEGAAFEELIGFHGGLGGKQTEPFVLHPATFPIPDEHIVGAASIHKLFKGWLADVAAGLLPPPWEQPTAPEPSITMPEVLS